MAGNTIQTLESRVVQRPVATGDTGDQGRWLGKALDTADCESIRFGPRAERIGHRPGVAGADLTGQVTTDCAFTDPAVGSQVRVRMTISSALSHSRCN